MDREKLKEINKVASSIHGIETALDIFSGGEVTPSDGLFIEVNTCYSDMGLKLKRSIHLDGDIADTIYHAIRDVLKSELEKLQNQFEQM